MDVIDEVMEEKLDALLDDSEPLSKTLKKINETSLDKEFKEFMAVDIEEIPEQEEEFKDNFEELPIEEILRIKNSIQDPPTDLEMKPFPKHLEYAFLEKDSLLPVVISTPLKDDEKKRLVSILKKHKEAFAWKTSDIPGISPSFCKHKINFEDDARPIIQRQRRLNPKMKEAVKKRLSNFPMLVSFTLSKIVLGHPKGSFSSTLYGSNAGKAAGNKFFCFLDGFSGYFQIPIEYADQEKTTFTYMLETSMEVFMDDFFVFGDSFDSYLANLEQMLIQCKQAHLVLNWEKCHFMVTEGIVLGHKVSSAGLEVDKAKIDVIAKLPPPTNVKAVRGFLGHAGFYHRFIKDFSKFSRPMTKLLEKDAVFDFNKECIKAFEPLKEKLTNVPIIVSPDWSQPFELICDASDFAVGAVLGQREEKHFHPIHFANVIPRLIRWILLLQEFDIEIKNKKGAENVMKGHLSRLENPNLKELKDEDIDDNFPDETLMNVSSNDEDEIPWKLDAALWAFRTAFKTLIGTTLYQLLYGKTCHLPFEIEHHAYWALRSCNPNLKIAGEKQFLQLHELDELRLQAYENSKLYKDRTKAYHDKKLRIRKEFKA
ncbi:reverse transcriptase domain-containing protein [Tanacetum coccineum]